MTGPIHVLLVEDNPGDADLTKETLEMSKMSLQISVVTDGTDALAYLQRKPPFAGAERPELILLDLNLPRMSGRELLAEIKHDPVLGVIPVVVLTSSDAEQDIFKSYQLGANCYVTKPVGLEAFQSVVRSVEHFWLTVVKLP